MPILLMRLEGPMQSWGTYSRFTERDTGREPSKSGVIGVICAAMGRPRDAPVDDLAHLRMAVRVDREGTFSRDFHTTIGVLRASTGKPIDDAVISNRYYLADACFLVLLEGERSKLEEIRDALANPKWAIYLGRKSFVPGESILLKDPIREGTIEDVIGQVEYLGREGAAPENLRIVRECAPGEGEPRMDVPVSFADRTFAQRYVVNGHVALTKNTGG